MNSYSLKGKGSCSSLLRVFIDLPESMYCDNDHVVNTVADYMEFFLTLIDEIIVNERENIIQYYDYTAEKWDIDYKAYYRELTSNLLRYTHEVLEGVDDNPDSFDYPELIISDSFTTVKHWAISSPRQHEWFVSQCVASIYDLINTAMAYESLHDAYVSPFEYRRVKYGHGYNVSFAVYRY